MAREGHTADFARTAVENMEENPFALLHSDRFAMSKHSPINGERAIAYLVAFWHSLCERRLHRSFPSILEALHDCGGGEKIHIHISAPAEGRFKFLQSKEEFTVVMTRIVLWLDVQRANETAVLTLAEVASGPD